MYFENVRDSLLNEAIASPNLLSDLAGLEKYIAESYHNRSFIELLQNADDAKATKFKIVKHGNLLFVANNGRVFNQMDLESLCRSASSSKTRGKTIGYRGIGFKSVVGFSKEIHVLSGDLELTFSKKRTKLDIPMADRVPLIRVPHVIDNDNRILINPIHNTLKSEGYSTVFVFTEVTANAIEAEFDLFEYNSLIFLKNVVESEILLTELISIKIIKNIISDSEFKLSFITNGIISNWMISNKESSSIAFFIEDDEVLKLPEEKALVHSFLPTEDSSGLGVLINGNISTDPSRRHLIFDKETNISIKLISNHILELLESNLKQYSKENVGIANALIPYIDPRMLKFKRNSFVKLLLEEIRLNESSFFKNLKLCPIWMNPKDFSNLVSSLGVNIINPHFYKLEGFNAFSKYLGALEVDFKNYKDKINDTQVSILGCVQLTKYIFSSVLSHNKLSESEYIDLKILHCNGQRVSLSEMASSSQYLDDSFIQLLLENGLTESDIKQVLKRFLPEVEKQLKTQSEETQKPSYHNSVSDWFNKVQKAPENQIKTSIKRWRNAEEQTLELLNLNGFNLEDVSKQNIGYDLGGYDPNGKEIQVEIKSITLPGQKFKLTNNEIAVAQERRDSFFIAVVRQNKNTFEIALISDPVNSLIMNRQCVQWIWECENYEYKPMIFEI
jgi:hypothetical protein